MCRPGPPGLHTVPAKRCADQTTVCTPYEDPHEDPYGEPRGGAFVEATDVSRWWRQDLVGFLLGCSFTFEEALTRAGLPPRHVEQGRNVPMYRTRIDTVPAGPFGGKLVVSMRPVPAGRVKEVYDLTRPLEMAHGAPVHAGDPAAIGIADLSRPDWGDAVEVRPGEAPVFWACGVTSQVALEAALRSGEIDLAITHAPGHMFIADLKS